MCVWIPFGFFSLASAKANYYIILCLPFMALLLADYLPVLFEKRQRLSLAMAILVPILTLIALWMYRLWTLSSGKPLPPYSMHDGSFPLTMGCILVLASIAIFFIHRGWQHASLPCLGGLIIPFSLELNQIVVRAESTMSARTMATYIEENFPEKPVLLFQDFESLSSLPIYLGRTIPVIDSTSADLFSGQKKIPFHPNFMTQDQVMKTGLDSVIVVMRNKDALFSQSKLKESFSKVTEIGPAALYVITSSRHRKN